MISAAVDAKPDGQLLHEDILFSLRHFGMWQYWRDFESLEVWSRSEPHRQWWQEFLRDGGGTGFWKYVSCQARRHRSSVRGNESPTELARFAPLEAARGAMFSARKRAGVAGVAKSPAAVTEDEFYSR
jgi:hypothetical protein